MQTVKVSIIMGTYNCEKYIRDSIDSIINQSFKDWEFIICDDGSKDNTYRILKEYEDKYPEKIRILKNNENRGLNYTLNKCLKEVNGEYIARQDGDDISLSNRLEKEVQFLDNNTEYTIVSSNMIMFDEKGEWGKTHVPEKPSEVELLKSNPFNHPTCLVRKQAYVSVKGYNENKKFARGQDYDLWFRMYEQGYKGYNIQEPLHKFRDNEESYKRRTWNNRIKDMKMKYRIWRNLNISFIYFPYIFRPIVVGLIPKKLYITIRKKISLRKEK